MIARRLVVVLAACALGACGSKVFTCTSDAQCTASSGAGTCSPSPSSGARYCVFGDSMCASKLVWDSSAGDGLAGTCTSVPDMGAAPVRLTWTTSSPGGAGFVGLWGAPGDLWLVDVQGALYHAIDDVHFTLHNAPQFLTPPSGPLIAMTVRDARYVYASSGRGEIADLDVDLLGATAPAWTSRGQIFGQNGQQLAVPVTAMATCAGELFVVGNDGTVAHVTPPDSAWRWAQTLDGFHVLDVSGAATNSLWALSAEGEVFRSTQGPGSFGKTMSTAAVAPATRILSPLPDEVWVGGGGGLLHRPAGASSPWVKVPLADPAEVVRALDADPATGDLYVATDRAIEIVPFGASAAERLTFVSSSALGAIKVLSSTEIIAVGLDGTVLRGAP